MSDVNSVTVDLRAEMVRPLSSAQSATRPECSERDLAAVGTCVRVCEVVCVGGRQVGRGRVRRYKKVKEDRGDTGALRDSCAGVSERGSGVVVSDAGHPPM